MVFLTTHMKMMHPPSGKPKAPNMELPKISQGAMVGTGHYNSGYPESE